MSTRYEIFQIRRGLSADFIAANTLLASGEPAYAIDTRTLKVGDGINRWNNLYGITGDTPQGIASENYVLNAISGVIDLAPDLLNTLNELAAALGDDANFATTVVNSINQKANLAGGNTFTGYNVIPSGNGNFDILSISGVGVSVKGHVHTSSDITNFNSSVSGLVNGYYAALSGASFTGSISSPSGSFSQSLKLNNVDVSVSGHTHVLNDITNLQSTLDNNYAAISHTHTASQVTDFATSVSGVISVSGNYAPNNNPTFTGYVTIPSGNGNFDILSVSGIGVSVVGHAHSLTIGDGTLDKISYLSNERLNIVGSGDTTVTYNDTTNTIIINSSGTTTNNGGGGGSTIYNYADNRVLTSDGTTSGIYAESNLTFDGSTLKANNIAVSLSGHNHVSSDITNFASSVSGLLPVKQLTAGYDVSITDNSNGSYSIASTNLVHIDSKQPQGFVNRTDSEISLSGNVFTIKPTGSSYSFYNQGIKVTKTSPETFTIPSGLTQINYLHFNIDTGLLDNKTTPFDFNTDIPIAFVAWNGGVNPSGQMTFFAEERHGIVMDSYTHKWIHNTFGAQYIDGLSIGNYVLGGNGSSNTHATFSISNGTLYQEDIEINITDSSSDLPFHQELSPIAQIPVYYHEGTTGQWVKSVPNDYALAYGANGPKYNLLSGGTWTVENVHNGVATRYFAVWILATNQLDNPVISILGQRIDGTQGAAESNNNWSDVNLTNLPTNEVQILYRLIYAGDADYTNTPKARLLSILDLRTASIVNTAGTPQNDHGSLFGLGDDDHNQYVHIDTARTISAVHTLSNGITFDGSGTQSVAYIPNTVNITGGSGNFLSLKVNSTGVSLSGHSHVASDITNFATSVSGIINNGYGLSFNSPTLTGVPLTPTATSGTNTNQVASTEYVRTEISNLVNSAPATLDTLNELATALGNDASFSTTVTNSLAAKAALAGATFTGTVVIPTGTLNAANIGLNTPGSGNFLSLKVNNTDVSVTGHTHTASNITDFNSSVSGLVNGIYAQLAGATFTGLLTGVSGNFTQSLQLNGTGVSLAGHTHTSSEISDSTTAGRALLTGIDAAAQRTSLGLGTIATEPSGNYSLSSHSHTASNITDFNTAVSGLLNVKGLVAGTGISLSPSAGTYTINTLAYTATIGNGSSTSFTITHNLNISHDVFITVRDMSTNYYVYPDIVYVDTNSFTVNFVTAPTSNQYKISVMGF